MFGDFDKVEIKDFIEANILNGNQKIKLVGSDIDIKKLGKIKSVVVNMASKQVIETLKKGGIEVVLKDK